jgi:hypothetical protein
LFNGVAKGLNEGTFEAAQQGQTDPKLVESIALGIDVVANLVGVRSFSLLASRGLKRLLKYECIQNRLIRRKLGRKYATNPQLVDFLGAWAHYIRKPSLERERDFRDHLNRLDSTNKLFDIFAFALQQSKYKTLVLAIDELTRNAVDKLKILWDPPVTATGDLQHSLNLVFVLACMDWVRDDVVKDASLRRRFCDPPCGHYEHHGPKISSTDCEDDFRHVVRKVQSLLVRSEYMRKPEAEGQLDALRRRLASQGDMTWQMLWHAVISVLVKL